MKNKKNKHNKKRNTAFLYEILVREITRSIVNEDREKEQVALGICKDFFRKGSTLREERDIYDSLLSLGDGYIRIVRAKLQRPGHNRSDTEQRAPRQRESAIREQVLDEQKRRCEEGDGTYRQFSL